MSERREQKKRPVAVVINDDVTQLNVLAGLLLKEDLEVRAFESAEAAMDAMKRAKPPDIIVTDLYMPGIDGWRFCRLLRSPEFSAFNHVPILIVSATFSGDEASRITSELGANAFLSMPAEAPRLIRTVRALIRGEEPRHPSRALIVEDSGTLSGILSKTFTDHGYKTDTALTGAEATEKFMANTPDVVVLTYPLPDVASDALLEDFRRTNPDVVCIMMTLDPRPELALEWIKKGADAHVRMPFQPEYLIELCARFRRERSLLRVEDFLKQRTQQLYEAEKRYRSIFENAVEGIFQSTPDGRYITVNPAFAKMCGYESPEKMMADVADIEKQLYVSEDRQEIKRLLEKEGRVRELETAFRRKDGSRLWASVNATAVRGEKGNTLCYEGTVVDITERKRLEAQIIQSQKMEAVGTLAGGIAHDFNNILASIIGYTELAMLKGISESSQAGDCLDQVLKASQRARDLVKQILMFSRQSDVEKKPVQLTPIIKETVKFLRATLPTNIEIKRRISATSDVVLADPIQIHQVLMNLCTNAAHAMRQEGGVLKIMMTDMDADDPSESLPTPRNDVRCLAISVSDTGHGIDPEHLDKIFDPFFTTKSSGEGTGMGLSVVYGIVKDLNGNITVQSEQNKGATFSISLPRCEEQFVPSSPLPLSSLPTGSECVLLVDDEESLVNMVQDMLHYLGYKVIPAMGSMEALDAFRTLPEQFDLVITDLTMPEMSGFALADELLKIRPDIPILLCTGLGQAITVKEAISRGIRQVLMKPFTMENCAIIVREILDEGKTG
ncbi:MAG: response regulator [Deltaproteobacteria bacterium]|nr:response regulator [Deltaproteobacteria bacterium]